MKTELEEKLARIIQSRAMIGSCTWENISQDLRDLILADARFILSEEGILNDLVKTPEIRIKVLDEICRERGKIKQTDSIRLLFNDDFTEVIDFLEVELQKEIDARHEAIKSHKREKDD